MDAFQPRMHYEDIDDALHDAVMFLGGFKKVAPMLWPPEPDGKSLDEAATDGRVQRQRLAPHIYPAEEQAA